MANEIILKTSEMYILKSYKPSVVMKTTLKKMNMMVLAMITIWDKKVILFLSV